jgi:hypothetical protein
MYDCVVSIDSNSRFVKTVKHTPVPVTGSVEIKIEKPEDVGNIVSEISTLLNSGSSSDDTESSTDDYENINECNVDENGTPFYKNIPHDKYGWNRIKCQADDYGIYYKGKLVISLDELKLGFQRAEIVKDDSDNEDENDNEDKEIHQPSETTEDNFIGKMDYWYYVWVDANNAFDPADKGEWNLQERTIFNKILYFDGHPMTNAHCHFHIYKNE